MMITYKHKYKLLLALKNYDKFINEKYLISKQNYIYFIYCNIYIVSYFYIFFSKSKSW